MARRLWNRDFALAFTGYFLLFLSVTLFYIFPLFLDRFQPSKGWVGIIMGVHSITAVLVRPYFGRAIDARGGRRMALLGVLIMVAVVPFFHLVTNAGALPLVLRALMGVGWGIGMTAAMAICSDLAPLDRLAHSIGVVGVAGITANALGPTLAEEIVRYGGWGGLFNASVVLLGGAMACFLVTREMPRLEDSRPDPPGGARRHRPAILLIIAAMPVFHGAVRGAVVNFIALFGRSAGFSRIGPFFLAFSAAAILTRFGVGDLSDRWGRKQVILPAAILISFNLFWISAVRSYGTFILNGFIAGLGQGLIFPALSTYIIDYLGRQNKGLALGLYMSLFDLGMGLGSPLLGWVSDMLGYRPMYVAAGVLLLLSTLVFSLKAPRPGIPQAAPEPT